MKDVSHGQLVVTVPQTSKVARLLELNLPLVQPVVETAKLYRLLYFKLDSVK